MEIDAFLGATAVNGISTDISLGKWSHNRQRRNCWAFFALILSDCCLLTLCLSGELLQKRVCQNSINAPIL